MKAVVTGGTGFLGRHVVWRLAREGFEVIFTGRSEADAATVLRLADGTVRWQALEHGHANAGGKLSRSCDRADVVVHCAALSTPWGSAEAFRRANVDSTAEVLQACRAAEVPRLIHVSTPSLYFDFSDRLAIREDASLPTPVNEYARTKAQAEALVRAAPVPHTVILRPRALFGPWDRTLMPRLLRVMRAGALPLMNGGKARLDLTCIDNAVDAVWLAATRPLPHALATYNVSNGESHTLIQLLQAMAKAFDLPLRTRRMPWPLVRCVAGGMEIAARLRPGREPLMTRYSAGVLAFSQTLDTTALRTDLDWEPKASIAEGLRRQADWWRQQNTEAAR